MHANATAIRPYNPLASQYYGSQPNIAQVAADALEHFDSVWLGSDWMPRLVNAPAWLERLVRDVCPLDEPDDHALRVVRSALILIEDAGHYADLGEMSERFARERRFGVRTFGDRRASWFESSPRRRDYCAQALEQGICPRSTTNAGRDRRGIGSPLAGAGQYVEALEVYRTVITALRAVA